MAMFGKKIEQAKSSWPIDKVNAKAGCVEITGQYVKPTQRGIVGLVAAGLAVPLALTGVGIVLIIPIIPGLWMLLKSNLRIRIDNEAISIRGKRYARIPGLIEFRVGEHQRAYSDNPGVYANALEVVMQYGERRIVVAEMRQKDHEKATALAFRLQTWSKEFPGMMAAYQGLNRQAASEKGGEFGPAPDVR